MMSESPGARSAGPAAGQESGGGMEGGEGIVDRLTAILEEAGIYVAVELRDGSGGVESEENRQAALDVATAVAAPRGLRVDDAIDVMDTEPDTAFRGGESEDGDFAYVRPEIFDDADADQEPEMEPDFTESIGTTDSEEAAAEATPYFPPTDPVVRPSRDPEALEIVGGFGAMSMDDLEGAAGFDPRNDDDLTMAVQRELAEDALTTDLRIRVAAADGVVVLRGAVPCIEDAENAEAVAGRVGGVQEVREELSVVGMGRR
jgi:hypothetical protein